MSSHWKETFIFLCFVIVAAALWYGHAMTSVRTEIVPINVQYTGIDSNIAFTDSLPSTISVEVRDAGQRIKTYFKDQPTITINLHSQLEGSESAIDITEEQLRISVNSVLQGTSKLLTLNPVTLHGTFYRQIDKQVPVVLQAHITPAPEYQLAVKPTLNKSTIQVFGEASVINQLDTVYTQPYSLDNVKDTLVDWAELILPKGVRANVERVDFTAVTERFTEKAFTLPIMCEVPDSTYMIRLFPYEASVTVRCAIRDFNQVSASDIMLHCAFPTTKKERLNIIAITHNPKITMLRVNPSYVEYIVEQKIKPE